MAQDPIIPPLVASGATDRPDASGAQPAPQPAAAQPAPASDAQMIAQGAKVSADSTPAVIPGATPTPTLAQPQGQPAGTPAAPAQPVQSPHEALYSRFLKVLAPPTKYIDNQGQTQYTKPSLSNSILAGAIAGLMQPTAYRNSNFGPVVDTQQTAFNAFQAGQTQSKEHSADVQKAYDDAQSRKLGVAKSNADMMHLYSATMQDSDKMSDLAQGQVDNFAPTLKIATDHDQNLTPGDTKAVLASGMTMADALKHPEFRDAMLRHSLIPDGVIQVPDVEGRMVPTQTFSVIDPNVKVSMTKEAADIASQINPQWSAAFEGSGGSMKMRLGQLQQVTNQVNSVQYAEQIFGDAAKSDDTNLKALGLKGDINGEIMSAVRQGAPGAAQARASLMVMENAKAAGGTTADVLNRLINDPDARPGSAYILQALGTTADKVQAYVDSYNNERIRQAKIAQESGDKAPADSGILAQIPTLAKQMGLSPAEVATASAELPKTGATRADVAKVLENIRHQHDTNAQLAAGANRDQGDPAMIERVARNLVDNPSSLTTMRDIGTRGTQRLAIIDRAEQIAKSEGKQFDTGLINQRVKFLEQYEDPKGKAAINRQAINNIMQHAADVSDLNQLNRRSNVRVVNTPINALKDQFGDQVFTQYQTAVGVLKDELGLYFAGGYSPTKDQQAMWDKIQSDTATPAQTEAFSKEVVRLATRRADTFNQQFKTNMGYDDPNMLTPQAKSAAERLGLGDAVTQFKSGGQLGTNGRVQSTQPYAPVNGDRPIMKNGNVVGYLSTDGTRHNL